MTRSNRQSFRVLATGALGAILGASCMLFAHAGHGGNAAIAGASTEDDQQKIIEAVKHVGPSVVALDVDINGTRVTPADPFQGVFGPGFGPGQLPGFGNSAGGRLTPFHEQASGSGFIYSKQGLILTNDHVVHGASKIEVVFANGDRVPGHIYAENNGADLALVQVEHYAKLPPPVQFGSSSDVEQGEWAIAIGEPFELKQTVTLGVVSGFNRAETIGGEAVAGVRDFKGLLQTSAPINPGNSGGPLIDMDGRVIGINQSVERPAQGIGFAIPIDTVKTVVAMLQRHEGSGMTASSAGFLGVQLQPLDAGLRSQLDYTGQGAAIAAVVSGSPADQAGLQPGDVIQSVDAKTVHSPADVTSLVHAIAPGKTATLRVREANGTRELVAVQLGSQPDQSD
jgi:S1-C subfamily serine protease